MNGWRALALVVPLAACAGAGGDATVAPVDPAQRVAVGAGGYITARLPGEKPPSNHAGHPVKPKLTPELARAGAPPPTNDWWSSLIWQFDRAGKRNPHSEPMFAHPLALKALPGGLGLGGAGSPEITGRSYFFPYQEDVRVGVEGLSAPDTRVQSYDDWIVTARWQDDGAAPPRTLSATFGHGLPFAYFEAGGGAAVIDLRPDAEVAVFADVPGTLGVTVGGRAYGLFAPAGASWTRLARDRRLRSDLRGQRVFSVALLPDARPATLARFRKHAFAFVTGARVSWQYDRPRSEVRTRFALETVAHDRNGDGTPLLALYPHQWKHLGRELAGPTYVSPRGPMKLLAAPAFETRLPFGGVLPVLPRPAAASGFDADTLASQIRAAARADDLFPKGLDGTKGTYWTGKSLQRVSLLAWLAEQVGETEVRAQLVTALKGVLEDWFDGQPPNLFHYDKTWGTLVGFPSEYRSGWELNDHHFHYGQYLFAAATVARFDPAWAAAGRWGGMVELLVRDSANPDRGDRRFPFLRHFDPYAGHSWANGPALFPEGNNQESSSEDANFATALILWGELTQNRSLADLGVFLHATLTAAIEQYWFDVDDQNFPPGFDRPALGMVWGSGGKYDTWWDRNPIYVHGINYLPFTGGSLYLGRRPEYVRRNHQALVAANRGEPRLWRELVWMYLALGDPGRALEQMRASPHFEPEFGNSRAFTYQWLHALASFGQVDSGVGADAPTFAVLRQGATRHHVAWNPSGKPTQVRFSDGVVVKLGPHEQKLVSATWTAGP